MLIKKKIQLITAFSVSNLLLTSYWLQLGLYSQEIRYYFYKKPVVELWLGISLFIFFSISFYKVFTFLNNKKYYKTEHLIKFLLLINALNIFRRLSNFFSLQILLDNKIFLFLTIFFIIVIFFKFIKIFSKLIIFIFLIFSPFVLMNTFHIINMGSIMNWDNNKLLIGKKNYPDKENKIIHFIFDELDPEIVEKQKNKNLNNFFKSSDHYINAYTKGQGTLQNMISILTGKELIKIVPNVKSDFTFSNNNVFYKYQNNKISVADNKNIFSILNKKKYKVGVMGIYHRYCNIFYKDLNQCIETGDETYSIKNIGFKEYFFYSIASMIPASSKIKYTKKYSYSNFLDYNFPTLRVNNILKYEKKIPNLIKNNDYILIHIPLPHAPWIYKDGKFNVNDQPTQDGFDLDGYYNNVLITDIFFQEIINKIKSMGLYDESTIILSSDHGWRNKPGFSYLGNNKFVLAIKNSYQKEPKTIPKKFGLHNILKIIENISN